MATKLSKAAEIPALSDAMETVWHKTTVHIYPVSDSQLRELAAGYNSMYLVFFGICAGAAVSLGTACPQITNTAQRPYYFAAFLVSVFAMIFFGIAGFGRYRRAAKAKKRLENSLPLVPPKPL